MARRPAPWPSWERPEAVCPLCPTFLGEQRTGGHLPWCVYQQIVDVVYGPVDSNPSLPRRSPR